MSATFREVSLTREQLKAAQEILDKGCTGEVTLVFADKRVVGTLDVSAGFAIEPQTMRCMYGCKNDPDIAAAVTASKGIALSADRCKP
jgi:hypothetical protein